MNIKEMIDNLSDRKRKIIFWLIIILVGLSLLIVWLKTTEMRLKRFRAEKLEKELNLPLFRKNLENLPKFELKIKMQNTDEELKKLEEETR